LSLALLFIDLDSFKAINDTHGHAAGDCILKTVATRLIEQVRPGDTVSRLAGDEFLVLCEQLEQPGTMSNLAERINDSLRLPFDFNGIPLYVTASIGIAIGTGSTHSPDDLLRAADTAMYAVKGKGRDNWQFFSESLHEQAKQRLAITNGLREAIERNEMTLRFQPIVAAESGQILGAEALLRWRGAEGDISPATFIPIAEMTGAIVKIGLWVFRESCRAQTGWQQLWGGQAPYVSVNVSTRQLGEDSLADDFAAILAETKADPRKVLLEITETSLMADVEANLRVLRRLAELGLRVAVDDFGTGYSSLAQLTRLPVNVLKIDKAFVDGIATSEESRMVIRAVIGLGRSLGLKLVAEGVENETQVKELCSYGCDFIQGYFFHRPLEGKAFAEVMNQQVASD
jgi:diguanylate cyclase (GGDEF)-like protein